MEQRYARFHSNLGMRDEMKISSLEAMARIFDFAGSLPHYQEDPSQMVSDLASILSNNSSRRHATRIYYDATVFGWGSFLRRWIWLYGRPGAIRSDTSWLDSTSDTGHRCFVVGSISYGRTSGLT